MKAKQKVCKDETYLPDVFHAVIHVSEVSRRNGFIVLSHDEDVLYQTLILHRLERLAMALFTGSRVYQAMDLMMH